MVIEARKTRAVATRLTARPALQKVRVDFGYSQSEMADMLSVVLADKISYSLYQKIEQGRKTVDSKVAMQIARELDVKFAEIWSNDPIRVN